MEKERGKLPRIERATAIGAAVLVAICFASTSYRSFLAKGASDAARYACADHNLISGSYKSCLEIFSRPQQYR
jgi:hypothetical protein